MKLITTGDFAAIARAGAQPPADLAVCRDVTNTPQAGTNGRTIRYVLSDPSVGRDGHTIAAAAWQLGNYRTNPVFLWAHDSDQLPIGRMVEIGTVGDRLMGTAQFPDEGEYPFADTVFNLYRSGYLNATSAGWMPLENGILFKDRNRVGGIDFTRVFDALEFSAVPVPALPTALVTARSAGIDTKPIFDWAEKVLDGDGDRIVIPRREIEELHRAAGGLSKNPPVISKPDADDAAVAARRARAEAIRKQYEAEDEAVARRRAHAAQLRAQLGIGPETPAIALRRALARKIAAEIGRPVAGSAR